MLFQVAEKFFSPARLAPYLNAAQGDQTLALQLYSDNLRLAQSFYFPLACLEIALRNALHETISRFLGTDNWLITERQGFMVAPSLTGYDRHKGKIVTNNKVLKMVESSIEAFPEQHNGRMVSSGPELIPELNFGFWTTLLTKNYTKVLGGRPVTAFVHKPAREDAESINGKLFKVRLFRNRMYHYEALCFQADASKTLCFSQILNIHRTISDLIKWLDPSLAVWVDKSDQLPQLIKELRVQYPKAI